jgi:hypothetical protein
MGVRKITESLQSRALDEAEFDYSHLMLCTVIGRTKSGPVWQCHPACPVRTAKAEAAKATAAEQVRVPIFHACGAACRSGGCATARKVGEPVVVCEPEEIKPRRSQTKKTYQVDGVRICKALGIDVPDGSTVKPEVSGNGRSLYLEVTTNEYNDDEAQ